MLHTPLCTYVLYGVIYMFVSSLYKQICAGCTQCVCNWVPNSTAEHKAFGDYTCFYRVIEGSFPAYSLSTDSHWEFLHDFILWPQNCYSFNVLLEKKNQNDIVEKNLELENNLGVKLIQLSHWATSFLLTHVTFLLLRAVLNENKNVTLGSYVPYSCG